MDVKWIKIATDIFDNRKIRQIELMPEGDAILVIWFKLLCLAGQVNDGGMIYLTREIPYTEEMLAGLLGRPLRNVTLALRTFEQYGMIQIVNSFLCLPSWEKYQDLDKLNKIREQNRARQTNYRSKKKQNDQSNAFDNVTETLPVTLHNATDKDIDKNNIYSDFFERVWAQYPNKKGKGRVSPKKLRELYEKVGEEQLVRCIQRYCEDQEQNEWRKFQNGSTFFNSGYADYLDDVWEEAGEPDGLIQDADGAFHLV